MANEKSFEFIKGFMTGAGVMREMQARFVEQGGDPVTAGSIRANWNPTWGFDPGRIPDDLYETLRTTVFFR